MTWRRRLHAFLPAAGLTLLAWLLPAAAPAAGGSYATTGTGTYAQSLWWLDFSAYSSASATGAGQAFSFSLPSGAGTLSATVTASGTGSFVASASPSIAGYGAIGHGAYNGISGAPSLYWFEQAGNDGALNLKALSVRDSAGNVRNFMLVAADGENTNGTERLTFTSTANWRSIDVINYYSLYNGGVPASGGTGTTTFYQTGPSTNDNNYNASLVVATLNPTQVTMSLTDNEAGMFAVAMPTVTLTVNVAARVNAVDQFSASVTYTSPASSIKTAATSGTSTSATSGATSVIGSNGITLAASMAAGSVTPLSAYTGSMACTNSGPGAQGSVGAATVLPAGAGTAFTVTPQAGDSLACVLTLTPWQPVMGSVYVDVNHDATLDNGETGGGLTGLYVKLAPVSNGLCQSPATVAAAVNTGTGAYTLTSVAPGTYCVILTNSSALGNVTAYLPPGYVGTEAAIGIRTVTLSGPAPAPQNFGLYSGAQLALTVFGDTGRGGGGANDGVQNGAETGLGTVLVTATVGGAAIATATTSATGGAVLWLPSTSQGASVSVTPAAGGNLATGGSAGTTGGTYARPTVNFVLSAGTYYSGVTFGLVPPSTLSPQGAETVRPGGVVFYPHTLTAGSAGQVSFATSAAARPAITGFTEVIYLDSGCSAQYSSADPVVSAPLTVLSGATLCILVKEFAPANAPPNASNVVTVRATLTYGGAAAPAASVLTTVDVTTLSATGAMSLTKLVQNVSAGNAYATNDAASPGDMLQYQITIANLGSSAVTAVNIDDATPAYTTFVSASCPAAATLPGGITSCALAMQPTAGGTGPVQWSLAGSLAPGGQTTVTFQVRVAP